MSLFHRLHGARWCALRQKRRRCDGVRGVFSAAPLDRGDLVMSVPLRFCYITHLDYLNHRGAPSTSSSEAVWSVSQQLRRCNRGVALFPEAWMWLQIFSEDSPAPRVSLTSAISCETALQSTFTVPKVVSLTLSPVEAAVATSVALRYFYSHALNLSPATRLAHSLGPEAHDVSDRFVASLPFDDYLRWGLESIYTDNFSAEAHLCLEQVNNNLRDAILTHANNWEYNFLEKSPSLFDTVLLISLYLVRARVLRVPLLSRNSTRLDSSCCVFAPGLASLNHCGDIPSAAVVVSEAQRCVVVRALRSVARGEEITIDYRQGGFCNIVSARDDPEGNHSLCRREICMSDDWATRYLMNVPV